MNKYDDLVKVCNENPWLASDEYDIEDYRYIFKEMSINDDLQKFFEHGNWAIRQGIIIDNLAFVQQVDGGDEWLALKKEDGKWNSFESISFGYIIKHDGAEYFNEYMDKLKYCSIGEYWNREIEMPIVRVLKIEPEKAPYVKEIPNTLESFQAEVGGGLIECVCMADSELLICNEEGKLKEFPLNRTVGDDIIAGSFLICGSDYDGNFTSLTDKQLEKYSEQFAEPEQFEGNVFDGTPHFTIISF